MSRSGYSDDCDGRELNLWRGVVARAIRGHRGQSFMREMLDALDAMPEKRLIDGHLHEDGAVCAIGSVGVKRGIDMSRIDVYDRRQVSATFDIAPALAAEIAYMNDEYMGWREKPETPEERFTRMRAWIESEIVKQA